MKKKVMKKVTAAALTLAMSVGILAGCGSGDSGTSGEAAGNSQTESTGGRRVQPAVRNHRRLPTAML